MNIRHTLHTVAKVFMGIFTWVLLLTIVGGAYTFGYLEGRYQGQIQTKNAYTAYVSSLVDKLAESLEPTPVPTKIPTTTESTPKVATNNQSEALGLNNDSSWGGPDLWAAINDRRIELGVNPLNQKDNLCTIASIRLNELLELGKLDGHEGFTTMTERRPDLAHIFEDYSTVAEFLAAGGESASETVTLWENSLGHRKVVTGGEYVWGCIYAQNSFAVAITAF